MYYVYDGIISCEAMQKCRFIKFCSKNIILKDKRYNYTYNHTYNHSNFNNDVLKLLMKQTYYAARTLAEIY